MAVNCCLVPNAIVAEGGLTVIDTNAVELTVSVAEALIEPMSTPMVVIPWLSAVATPAVPGELLIVATFAAVELQCPRVVRSCVVPSVYVPVALNCCVVPKGVVAFGGLMMIDVKVAAATVKTVDPVTNAEVALMVADPVPMLVASPTLLMLAVETVSEAHVAVELRSCVLPSLNVPVAINCCVVPKAMKGFAGVTAIDCRTAAVTLIVVLPLIVPEVAIICAEPVPTLNANPAVFDTLLIVATVEAFELHCTVLVKSCVLPSVKVPVAVNCRVMPNGMLEMAGVIARETNTAGVMLNVVEPVTVPEVAVTLVVPTATLVASP